MKRLKKLSIAFLMLVTICPSAVFADDLSITVNNAPTYNVCDINRDGVVNLADLVPVLLQVTGKAEISPKLKLNADVNGDGKVDILDLKEISEAVNAEFYK